MAVIKSHSPNTWTVAVCTYRHISTNLKGRKNSSREAKTKPVSLWSKCCKLQVFTSNLAGNYKWDYSILLKDSWTLLGFTLIKWFWALILATQPRRKCSFTYSPCAAALPLTGNFTEHSWEILACEVAPVGPRCKNSTEYSSRARCSGKGEELHEGSAGCRVLLIQPQSWGCSLWGSPGPLQSPGKQQQLSGNREGLRAPSSVWQKTLHLQGSRLCLRLPSALGTHGPVLGGCSNQKHNLPVRLRDVQHQNWAHSITLVEPWPPLQRGCSAQSLN